MKTKQFYIETDRLIQFNKPLRYVYTEDGQGQISFVKIVDPGTKEEMTLDELKTTISPDALLNIATAHLGRYERVYF